MADDALIWRMEKAFLLAWPAPRRESVGDWLLQFTPGISRRANSANPRHTPIRDLETTMAECERRYRAADRPVLFRVLSAAEPAVTQRLDRSVTPAKAKPRPLMRPSRRRCARATPRFC